MGLGISLDEKRYRHYLKQLGFLTLPKNKRFRILKQLSRWEIKNTRDRVRQQKDIDGRSIAPRKKDGKRALRKMPQGMEGYVKQNATLLEVTWKSRRQAQIAARHHDGNIERVTAQAMAKRFPVDYDEPCSKIQALRLRKLNYQVKSRLKSGRFKYKKPSTKWIQDNLTSGQAGFLIRTLDNKKTKSSWDIELPKRKILGTEQNQVTDELLRLLQQQRK